MSDKLSVRLVERDKDKFSCRELHISEDSHGIIGNDAILITSANVPLPNGIRLTYNDFQELYEKKLREIEKA